MIANPACTASEPKPIILSNRTMVCGREYLDSWRKSIEGNQSGEHPGACRPAHSTLTKPWCTEGVVEVRGEPLSTNVMLWTVTGEVPALSAWN